MTGNQTLLELALSKGFTLADRNDPIYKEGLTVSVSPSPSEQEMQSLRPDETQSSPLDLQSLSFDPAQKAMESVSGSVSPEQ